jgi:hypothetical protein
MHARDEIVSYGHFDAEIIKLGGLLTDMGIGVTAESDLNQQAYPRDAHRCALASHVAHHRGSGGRLAPAG